MKNVILILLVLSSFNLFSQIEYSSFTATGRGGATTFVTDYQALGINPANLGWHSEFEEKKFAMGFNEFTYSIHSGALSKQTLRDEFKSAIRGEEGASFTYDEKVQAAKDFSEAGLALNVNYGSFGFAYHTDKFGGIAFRINDNLSWYSKFNEDISEILFLGKTAPYFDSLMVLLPSGDTSMVLNDTSMVSGLNQDSIINGLATLPSNISKLFDGSQISLSWTREYNLSYGRKIIEKDSVFALYAGVGIKYFQGMAYVDITSNGDGQMEAFSSMSSAFGINYGDAAALNPSADSISSSFLPRSVGHGFGMDFGVNILLFNKLKIGLAVNNIGSMTWDGNVYTVKDTLVFDTQSAGLDNFNVASQLGDILGEDGVFEYNGLASKTVKLPTVVRFGASIELGKKIELGFDMILPTNEVPGPGSSQNAIIGFGGDVQPIPWIRFSAGVMTGGNYDMSIPIGLTFVLGKGSFEAGIASRDAITFFVNNGPTLSLSTGFMRFRF
jgi:hypothetical protein